MRFVSVAEVRQVLGARHVGLGDQDCVGLTYRQQGPQQPDQLVHLGQVYARRPEPLPGVGDRVEPQKAGAVTQLGIDDLQVLDEDVGIRPVDVDLVGAERAPNVAWTERSVDAPQQRGRSRPDDRRQVVARVGGEEVVDAGWLSGEELREPATARRHMVQHDVDHQGAVGGEPFDVGPIADGRVDGEMVDDREPVVAGRGVERQDVDGGHDIVEVFRDEPAQRDERRLARGAQAVGVGDEDRVAGAPRSPGSARRRVGIEADGGEHPIGQVVEVEAGGSVGVEPAQMGPHPLTHRLRTAPPAKRARG